ncbi:substrate-binding domain-containing protein [Sporobolomyces koalae]|uniref:substrate-binding domain-containing protein n=1 Tax=Sporobolomyces koalae TaxID=500713 RepID=UPI00317B2D19
MSTPKLRVGYVREHFSSPLLQLAAKDESIELVECPSGTGQVMSRIKANEIDVAIALTESLLAGIAKKTAEFKLVGTYVTSPLQWAVIVGKDSKYEKLEDLKGEKIGISRIGSGSQVMASVMALNEGWVDSEGKVSPIDFEVLDTFKNLRDGVNSGKAAAFMWEKFTTRPYLDEVRFIGVVPTPWHSWAVVASPTTLSSTSPLLAVLERFLSNLTESIRTFDASEARANESVQFVQTTFGYPEEDVRAWFDQVSYPQGPVREIEQAMVEKTFKTLEAAGVLNRPEGGWNLENFIDTNVAKLV